MPATPNCAYKGILQLPFKTYTTTYPAKNGVWNFNPSAPIPMEFWGYAAGEMPTGLYANLIDYNTGYTTISVGDNDNAHTGVTLTETFGQPSWISNTLLGWCYGNAGLIKNPVAYSYAALLGHSYTLAHFNPTAGINLNPHTSNTGAPLSRFPSNIPSSLGGVCGGVLKSLVPAYYSYFPNNTIIGGADVGFNLSPALEVICGIASGTQWLSASNSSTTTLLGAASDLLAGAAELNIIFENPPNSTIDVNAIMDDTGNLPSANPKGFCLIQKSTVIVENITLVGFGILVAPDFATYQILQLIPTDGNSFGWTTQTGDFGAKQDASGALFMKNGNSSSVLYVAPPPMVKVLPLYMPIAVPDHGDTEYSLLMMRGLP